MKKSPDLDDSLVNLTKHLDSLDAHVKKQISFKRNILMAIVSGAGYALGASLVAAIIITILTWTIDSVTDIPLLNKILTTNEANTILQSVEP